MMLYITLEQQLFQTANDEFCVRVARTTEEIKALLEVGGSNTSLKRMDCASSERVNDGGIDLYIASNKSYIVI